MDNPFHADDESAISEISISPDGRIYVFGASYEILEVLSTVNDRDLALKQRIKYLRDQGDAAGNQRVLHGSAPCTNLISSAEFMEEDRKK